MKLKSAYMQPGPLREFLPGVRKPIPPLIGSGAFVEICTACLYNI